MARLTKSNRKKLKKAKATGDQEELDAAIERVTEDQLHRWDNRKTGGYGLVEDPESEKGRKQADEILRLAWKKLKEIPDQDLRDAIEEYEEEHGGPPVLDPDGEFVKKGAGGTTMVRWKKIKGGYQQTESLGIYIGIKWISKQKRGGHKCVVTAVMKTLLHELMGHWNKEGQKVSGSNRRQRMAAAERRADRVTDRIWRRLRNSETWDEVLGDLMELCEARRDAEEARIKKEIQNLQQGE